MHPLASLLAVATAVAAQLHAVSESLGPLQADMKNRATGLVPLSAVPDGDGFVGLPVVPERHPARPLSGHLVTLRLGPRVVTERRSEGGTDLTVCDVVRLTDDVVPFACSTLGSHSYDLRTEPLAAVVPRDRGERLRTTPDRNETVTDVALLPEDLVPPGGLPACAPP